MRLLVLGMLGGCAGVYAEVAATQMASGSIAPASGASMAVGGSTVGFNVGIEFGNSTKRLAMGYVHDALSYTDGSGTISGSSSRFDFNVMSLSERLKLRLALGLDFGSGSSSSGGMTHSSGGAGGAIAGLDATFFATWSTAVHVFVGGRYLSDQVVGGTYGGSGITFRATLSHTFGDVRPDQSFYISMPTSTDIVHELELGATDVGCVTTQQSHMASAAMLDVTCQDDRHVEYFQISDGMLVTCEHESSETRCRALSSKIADAAAAKLKAVAPPAATPAPAPAPEPAPAPAAAP